MIIDELKKRPQVFYGGTTPFSKKILVAGQWDAVISDGPIMQKKWPVYHSLEAANVNIKNLVCTLAVVPTLIQKAINEAIACRLDALICPMGQLPEKDLHRACQHIPHLLGPEFHYMKGSCKKARLAIVSTSYTLLQLALSNFERAQLPIAYAMSSVRWENLEQLIREIDQPSLAWFYIGPIEHIPQQLPHTGVILPCRHDQTAHYCFEKKSQWRRGGHVVVETFREMEKEAHCH